MMPHEPVLDIMRRTMINLEFVQRHAGGAGPFEVTQLVNSFLGGTRAPRRGELERAGPANRADDLRPSRQSGGGVA